MEQIGDWLTVLLVVWLLCSVVPVILLAIVALLAYKRLTTYLLPDPQAIQAEYQALRQQHPDLDRDALVGRIIQRQSVRSGVIGAITGAFGLVAMPITLPIDIYTSLRQQAAMVELIAYAYGRTETGEIERQIQSYLVMTGGRKITQATTTLLVNGALRFLGKFLSKLVPVLGALVGFAVNYLLTRITGRLSAQWYSRLDAEATGSIT